jgi:hypothetical protein
LRAIAGQVTCEGRFIVAASRRQCILQGPCGIGGWLRGRTRGSLCEAVGSKDAE